MNDIEQVKEKIDIVEAIRSYIQLLPAGRNFKANCPFHKEKTPSFVVSPDRQTWHCFGSCGEGGDVISFVMKYENISFYEALSALAEKAGIDIKRINPSGEKEFGTLYAINEHTRAFYKKLLDENEEAQAYLTSRGLRKETIEEFSLGLAPHLPDALVLDLVNNKFDIKDAERAGVIFKTERGTYMDRFRGRIMFPLANVFGKTVGFSARILPQFENENTGKYINSPETPIYVKSKIWFGLDKAKAAIREAGTVLVIEGQMDLLMLHQEGVRNVVATSGTALTTQQLETLKKLTDTIILGFDADEAGALATERAIDAAHKMDFAVKVFRLTEAKDAAEFIQKHPGKISHEIAARSISALEYYIGRFADSTNKKASARTLLGKIAYLVSPVEQSVWLERISSQLEIPVAALMQELELMKGKMPSVKTQGQSTQAFQSPQQTSRIEKIGAQILQIVATYPKFAPACEPYAAYFEGNAYEVISVLGGAQGSSPQIISSAAELQMRSALSDALGDEEKTAHEFSFLLGELKKEFVRHRRTVLTQELKKAEEAGEESRVAVLLKEFDELVKLIDN